MLKATRCAAAASEVLSPLPSLHSELRLTSGCKRVFPVAERCDYRGWRSPAQHPPGAAGQEERSQGETGNPSLTCPREETQTCQEDGGQEDERQKDGREGEGTAPCPPPPPPPAAAAVVVGRRR